MRRPTLAPPGGFGHLEVGAIALGFGAGRLTYSTFRAGVCRPACTFSRLGEKLPQIVAHCNDSANLCTCSVMPSYAAACAPACASYQFAGSGRCSHLGASSWLIIAIDRLVQTLLGGPDCLANGSRNLKRISAPLSYEHTASRHAFWRQSGNME